MSPDPIAAFVLGMLWATAAKLRAKSHDYAAGELAILAQRIAELFGLGQVWAVYGAGSVPDMFGAVLCTACLAKLHERQELPGTKRHAALFKLTNLWADAAPMSQEQIDAANAIVAHADALERSEPWVVQLLARCASEHQRGTT